MGKTWVSELSIVGTPALEQMAARFQGLPCAWPWRDRKTNIPVMRLPRLSQAGPQNKRLRPWHQMHPQSPSTLGGGVPGRMGTGMAKLLRNSGSMFRIGLDLAHSSGLLTD